MKRKVVKICILLIIGVGLFSFGCMLHEMSVEAYSPNQFLGSIYENASESSYSDILPETIERPSDEIVLDATMNYQYIDKEYGGNVSIDTYLDRTGLYIPETGTAIQVA